MRRTKTGILINAKKKRRKVKQGREEEVKVGCEKPPLLASLDLMPQKKMRESWNFHRYPSGASRDTTNSHTTFFSYVGK